jgi:hypothetical protein
MSEITEIKQRVLMLLQQGGPTTILSGRMEMSGAVIEISSGSYLLSLGGKIEISNARIDGFGEGAVINTDLPPLRGLSLTALSPTEQEDLVRETIDGWDTEMQKIAFRYLRALGWDSEKAKR